MTKAIAQTITTESTSIKSLNQNKEILKKIRGGLFVVIGFLLSPLSWWNDLFFNLPLAYGFGYLCSCFDQRLLLPMAIVGYWISNIAGILLMQFGVGDFTTDQSKPKNLKKELLTGAISSSAYTLIIITLVQLKILDTPILFNDELWLNLGIIVGHFFALISIF